MGRRGATIRSASHSDSGAVWCDVSRRCCDPSPGSSYWWCYHQEDGRLERRAMPRAARDVGEVARPVLAPCSWSYTRRRCHHQLQSHIPLAYVPPARTSSRLRPALSVTLPACTLESWSEIFMRDFGHILSALTALGRRWKAWISGWSTSRVLSIPREHRHPGYPWHSCHEMRMSRVRWGCIELLAFHFDEFWCIFLIISNL